MAIKTAEDIVTGEISVVEQAIQDLTNIQPSSVDLIHKKF